MGLRGEYIWDGTHLMGADTDTDDFGHESYILQNICYEYGEDLLDKLQEIQTELGELTEDQLKINQIFSKLHAANYDLDDVASYISILENYIREDAFDPDDLARAFDIVATAFPQEYGTGKAKEALDGLKGNLDPRIFGMKYNDYVLIRNNNFDVWGWNQKRANSIMSAIHDLIGHELEDPKSELWDETITVNDFSVSESKPYEMTIRELDENPVTISKAPVVTSKDERTPYLDPRSRGSSQAWGQRYTSEGFIGYIKRRDFKLYNEIKKS